MVEGHYLEGGDITYSNMATPALEPSKIRQYFTGTSVFITGATGFFGKLLMEKLLRTCPDIGTIYILIREKKGKSIEKRFEELLDNVFFDRLKREQPKFVNRIEIVPGDCILPQLGLNEKDRQKLVSDVHCVFHCAATVRFDEKIRTASHINIRATRDLLVLAKEMKLLKSFVYVSTAYSNCIRKDINEEFYESTITGNNLLSLLETLNDDMLDKITPTIVGEWPNTYVFTKAVAEEVVKTEGKRLPLAVVRPSIVISTAKEPIAGWIDNMYGATGVTVGVAVGLIHTLHCRKDCLADIVPADFVINCTIAAAWEIGTTKGTNVNKEVTHEDIKETEMEEKSDIPIYNYVSSTQNPITWQIFMKYSERHLKQIPSPLQVWHYCLFLNSSYYMHLLCVLFLHTIPAYFVDFLAACIGKERMLVKGYQKIHKFMGVLAYFARREWHFRNINTQGLWKQLNEEDQKLFHFDMSDLDWNAYFYTYARGGRVYLMKDPIDTIPAGTIKYWKLEIAHYTLLGVLFLALLKLVMILWSVIF